MFKQLTAAFLFSGGGGDTQGSITAGYKPLWAIEHDKYAASVYRYRFPDTQVIESDVRLLTDEFISSLPKPDLFIFGSPCTDLSTAGKRNGINGSHSSLFFEGVRFLRLQQPSAFIFENVAGIISSNNRQDLAIVLSAFAELGYMGSWQKRNGSRYVPQNRERVFFVGIHRGRAV